MVIESVDVITYFSISFGEKKMESIKIELELGPLRVKYEGSEQYAKDGLMGLISQVADIELPNVEEKSIELSSDNTAELQLPGPTTSASNLSTTDFAVKMGARSGTDLVMAAAAYLHNMRGMETFRRSDLLSEMKSAKAFYKTSYGGNLTKSLDTLIKSERLRMPSSETYALAYKEVENTKMLL